MAGSRAWALPVLALLLFAAALSVGVALTLAPALLLLAVLLLGHMPGEELLDRLRRAHTERRRRAPRRLSAPRLALVIRPAGRALAQALAMRPPPLLSS